MLLNKIQISEIINQIKNDKIVVIPTDTIYGISALFSISNQTKINNLKGSNAKKPLIVLFCDYLQIRNFVKLTPELKKLFESKEPTTVICQRIDQENSTIALRMVKKPDLRAIINETGPIFSTSANFSQTNYLDDKNLFANIILDATAVFYTEKLNNQPSRIINFSDLTKKR
ncbi:tRNA threonylcarbamoyladenosine biosynthesis protein [Spiroplasma sabaudiense Ar-1343]|uniref:L-threonylcarbamoyladenylate synthase n=1 Tax=Spiroplasma sabaudiense Ar-1343 TaxID=1276257 RepID=W6AB11_9MOLU|nr:Sua5/YciO/YrdC/YwlC family protein [Spiroplasma sabaudiense]AHI54212.1 tRNA threonylcarbamoyladenosine biosynthesis protein [Spiroplasma sabaudiense Ar-1343]